jgi:hypothetical protein
MTTNLSVAGTRPGTRRFYVGIAVAVLITVFLGFSRTYFLKGYYGTPELSFLLHVHGLVFTSWVLLFLPRPRWSPPVAPICIASLGWAAPCWPGCC